MVGIIGNGLGNSVTLDAMGLDAIPSGTGEVASASVGEGFASSVGPRVVRQAERMGLDQWSVDPMGNPVGNLGSPPPVLEAEEANRRYGIPGVLSFDKPVTEAVARDLSKAKHEEIVRQDTITRRPTSIFTGQAAQLAYGFVGGMLDPLNLAAALVPGVGEARAASMLGGMGGRVAARAVAGAAAGAAGMAALEPLNYALDQAEGNDWTMGSALRNIAFGGLLGGGLHVMGGAVGDAFRRRPPGDTAPVNPITERLNAAGPEARETLLRGAVAQHVSGEPVRVADALDVIDAVHAEAELTRWYREQQATEADALKTQAASPAPRDRSATLEAGRTRLTELRRAADELRGQAQEAAARAAPDAATAERLAAVEQELAGTIPAPRRAALENERDLLTQGRDAEADALERQRTQSEAEGLQRAADRSEKAATKAEADLAKLEAKAEAEAQTAAVQQAAASRADRIEQARLAGREAITQAMTERSIRRMAGSAGVRLDPAEAAAMARRVLMAQPDQVAAEIRNVVDQIGRRQQEIAPISAATIGGAEPGPGAAEAALFDATTRLRQAGTEAADSLRTPPSPDPVLQADDRAMTAAAERAPQVAETRGTKALAEAQKAADVAVARVQTEVAAGRLPEGAAKALEDGVRAAEGEAAAYEAAAACMAARIPF